MTVVEVSGASPYRVHIGHGNSTQIAPRARDLGARKVAIIYQQPLAALASEIANNLDLFAIQAHLCPIPDAESGKTLEVAGQLWQLLGNAGFGRQDLVVSVGGGAATDIAGFVAATWMRGIKVIHAPTSLLAMVDAAVGGKTGINTSAGKNLVGSFHEPDSVFVDLDRLATLPAVDMISGCAELIKTGFIADPQILALFQDNPREHYAELIERSVAVKASVVGQDLKEAGLREILNYGHTLGHAIELREKYSWRHGHAVAVGMMFVAHLAHNRGLIDANVVSMHKEILELAGLPTTYEGGAFDELYAAMTKDKKNRDGRVRFVVLKEVGVCTRLEDSTVEEMREAYAAISRS